MPQKYRNPNQFNLDDDPWSPSNFGLTPVRNQNQFGMSAEDDPWSPQRMGLQPLSTPNLRPPAESMYEPQSDYFNPPRPPEDDGFGWDDAKKFASDTFTVGNAIRFGVGGAGAVGAAALGLSGYGAPLAYGVLGGSQALGEGLARKYEGKPFSPGIMAVEAGLGMVPGVSKIPGAGAGARELLKYGGKQVLEGIGQGVAGTAPRKWADEGNLFSPSKWTMPTGREFASGGAAGGVFQGITGLGLGGAHIKYQDSLADLRARAGQPKTVTGPVTRVTPQTPDPLQGIPGPNIPPEMGLPPMSEATSVPDTAPDFLPGVTELPQVVTLRTPDASTLQAYLNNGYVRVPDMRSPEGYVQLVRSDVAGMYNNADLSAPQPQMPEVTRPDLPHAFGGDVIPADDVIRIPADMVNTTYIENMRSGGYNVAGREGDTVIFSNQPPGQAPIQQAPVQEPQPQVDINEPAIDQGMDLPLQDPNAPADWLIPDDIELPPNDIGNLRLQGTLGQDVDPSIMTQPDMGQIELPPVEAPVIQQPSMGRSTENPIDIITGRQELANATTLAEVEQIHGYWDLVYDAAERNNQTDFMVRASRMMDEANRRFGELEAPAMGTAGTQPPSTVGQFQPAIGTTASGEPLATQPAPYVPTGIMAGRSVTNPPNDVSGRFDIYRANTVDEIDEVYNYWGQVYDEGVSRNDGHTANLARQMMQEASTRAAVLAAESSQPSAPSQNIPFRPDRYNEPIYSLVDANELHIVQSIDNMRDLENLERLQQIEADTVLQNQAQNGVDEPPAQRVQRLVLEDETRRRRLELTSAHPDLIEVYNIHSASGITDAIGARLRQIVDAQNSGNDFLLNHAREVAQELKDRQDRMVDPNTMEFHGAPASPLTSAAIEPAINMASEQIPFTDAENAIINTLNMSTSQMVDTIEDVRTFDIPSLHLLHDDWHHALTQARNHHDTLSADEATRILDLITARIQTRTNPPAPTPAPNNYPNTRLINDRPEMNPRLRDAMVLMDLEDPETFNRVTTILDAPDRPALQNLRAHWGDVWHQATNAGDMAGANEADDMLAIIGNRIANIDRPGSAVTPRQPTTTTGTGTSRPPVHRPVPPPYTPTIARGPAFELGVQPRNTSQRYEITQEQYDRIADSPSIRTHLSQHTGGVMRRLSTEEMRNITASSRLYDWAGFGEDVADGAGNGPPGLSVEAVQPPSWSSRPRIVPLQGMTDQHAPGKYNIVWRNAQGEPVVNAIMEIYQDGSRMVNNLGGHLTSQVYDPATQQMKDIANPDFTPAFNAVGRRMVELDAAVTHGSISHHTGNLLVGILQGARIAGAPQRQRTNRPPRPGSNRARAIAAGEPDPALALREQASGPDRSGEGGFASLDVMVAMYEAIQKGLKAAPNLFKNKRNTFPDLVKALEIVTGKSQWFLSKVAKETQDTYNRTKANMKSERGSITIPGKPPTQGPPRQPLNQKLGIGQGSQPIDEHNFIREALNIPTNLTTSMDASAPGRQGLSQILTKEFWVAAGNMFKGITPAGFKQIDDALKAHPLHKKGVNRSTGQPTPSFGEQIGMKLFRPASEAGPRAEATASRWLETGGMFGPEKIFGVTNPLRAGWKNTAGIPIRASNRMYITFLNHLKTNRTQKLLDLARDMSIEGITTQRMPMPGVMGGMKLPSWAGGKRIGFTQAVTPGQAMDRNPYHNLKLAGDIAEFVNAATGHATAKGGLSLENAVKKIGPVLFSPGLMNSRIRMLNPVTYITADPFVRKQYLKAALSTAAAWFAVTELAKLAGGDDVEVSNKITSADFGKARMGDARLDAGGGFQQFLVFYGRLFNSGYTSSRSDKFHPFGEGYQAENAMSTSMRFVSNKLNPVAKFAWDIWDSSEYKPMHLLDRTFQNFAPLIIQDLNEIAKENPDLLPILGPAAAVGMGTQIYGKGESESKFVEPDEDILIKGDIRPWMWGRD